MAAIPDRPIDLADIMDRPPIRKISDLPLRRRLRVRLKFFIKGVRARKRLHDSRS